MRKDCRLSQTSKITKQVSFPRLQLEVFSLSHDKNHRPGLGATFFNICVGIVGCVLFSISKYNLSSCFLGYFKGYSLYCITSSHPSRCPSEFEDNFLLLACD